MCSYMMKVAVLAICVAQTMAMPGMMGPMMAGGFMNNPFMSGAMMGNPMMSNLMMANPMIGGPMMSSNSIIGGPASSGLEATFAAVKAIATINKQLGLSQAVLKKDIKTASNEVKLQLDALKTVAKTVPAENPCGATAEAAAQAIETELLTAFDRCQMKTEMQELRFQTMSLKTQMAGFKMAKKACKLELDPAQCLGDATEGATNNVTQVSDGVNGGIEDIMTKANECISEVKEELSDMVEDATDELLVCA